MNDVALSSSQTAPPGPRISPLRSAEWNPGLRLLLALAPGGTARPLNIFTTLARHGSLFWPWLAFAGKLLAGTLTARHRELVILRTAYRCGCEYERRHHRDIAREAGIREDEIAAIEGDVDAFPWEENDRIVIEVVDELHASNTVADATWKRLHVFYSETQLIELVMLVGHYHMVAFTLNALAVQPEPEESTPAETSSVVRAVRRLVLRGKGRSR